MALPEYVGQWFDGTPMTLAEYCQRRRYLRHVPRAAAATPCYDLWFGERRPSPETGIVWEGPTARTPESPMYTRQQQPPKQPRPVTLNDRPVMVPMPTDDRPILVTTDGQYVGLGRPGQTARSFGHILPLILLAVVILLVFRYRKQLLTFVSGKQKG